MVWEIADAVKTYVYCKRPTKESRKCWQRGVRGRPRMRWRVPPEPVVWHQDVNAWMTSSDVITSAWRGKRRWVRKSWTSAS